jgi:hypothetical protein
MHPPMDFSYQHTPTVPRSVPAYLESRDKNYLHDQIREILALISVIFSYHYGDGYRRPAIRQ